MVKGGKEKEKEKAIAAGPVFPRLHVNDTERGGPRAPPRNKMALYEQLSVPYQRSSSTASPLPMPQYARNEGNLHNNRSLFSPFHASSSTSGYSPGKVNSRSSDVENMKTTKTEFERIFTRHVDIKSTNAAKSVAEGSSLHPRDSPSRKNSCRKRVDDDEEDFRVPTFANSENVSYLNKDATGKDKKRLSSFCGKSSQLNSSVQFPTCEQPLEEGNTSKVKSVSPKGNHDEQKLSDALVTNENRDKSLCRPEVCKKLALASKLYKSSPDREDNITRNAAEQTRLGSSGTRQDSRGHPSISERDMPSEDTLRERRESHVEASPGNIFSNQNVTDNCNRDNDKTEDGQLQGADKFDTVSDTLMVDSTSGLEISPDDVVGVLGPKQFWKARRAIVNQQRVFALQVFELHRLLKVQKLFASSPHLLLEENPCTPPQKVPTNNPMIESNTGSHSTPVKQTVDFQKPNPVTECPKENPGVALLQAPPRPVREDVPDEGYGHPQMPSAPVCFQPPSNQWLVPVMSPSEGLIYKPYSGSCPPPAGFVAPLYGNYNPMSLPPGYGVPQSHPQQNLGYSSIASNYFPTSYGLPPMNPIVCGPVVGPPRPNGPTKQNSRSSCSMSFPKSDVLTVRPREVLAPKDNELQGSSASSPSGRMRGGRDVLPLFPMAPTAEDPRQPSEANAEEQLTRAIKAVPHNARSATESAARIFKSIQKERRHQAD